MSNEAWCVRIVQNRAPSELAYAMCAEDAETFVDRWREANPGRFIYAQSMPLIEFNGNGAIPVAYPDSAK